MSRFAGRNPRWLLVGGVTLALVALFSISRANANPVGLQYAPAGTVHVTYVSDTELATEGITLKTPPSDAAPATTKQQAEQVGTLAATKFGAKAIRESVLAVVDETSRASLAPKLMWVLDVQPPAAGLLFPSAGGLPGSSLSQHAKWVLIFVDAQTGEFDSDLAYAPVGFS